MISGWDRGVGGCAPQTRPVEIATYAERLDDRVAAVHDDDALALQRNVLDLHRSQERHHRALRHSDERAHDNDDA